MVQISAVIAGNDHNPTILNPDFLTVRAIVPAEWDWKVEATITTPSLSIVRYQSGVSLSVEPGKLQIVDVKTDDPELSRVADVASRYVTTLPHVRYTGVGINFQAIIPSQQPERLMKERFLKSGPWDRPEHPLETVGVRLAYQIQNGRLILSVDAGKTSLSDKPDQRSVLVLNANFHRDCVSYPADTEAVGHLRHLREDYAMFVSLVQDALGTEQ